MCKKTKFSYRQAATYLHAALRSHQKNRREVRKYFCKKCGHWHLTSKKKPPELNWN